MGVSKMALVAALAALASTWCAAGATDRDITDVAGALAFLVLGAGSLVSAWYALTAAGHLSIALVLRTGHGARCARRAVAALGAPVLRRSVVTGVGLSLALGAGPAWAGGPTPVPDDLRPGGPAARSTSQHDPPRAPGASDVASPNSHPAEPTPDATARRPADDAPEPSRPAATRRHTVVRGESLWRIAATALGPTASEADIDAEWRRWYTRNGTTIGRDPNIIHPGQVLLAPDEEAQP